MWQDLFITLLSMGRGGYQRLLSERKALVPHFRVGLEGVAARHGERLLHCPHNTISFAITLQVCTSPLAQDSSLSRIRRRALLPSGWLMLCLL